jgi:hypothetical protein
MQGFQVVGNDHGGSPEAGEGSEEDYRPYASFPGSFGQLAKGRKGEDGSINTWQFYRDRRPETYAGRDLAGAVR